MAFLRRMLGNDDNAGYGNIDVQAYNEQYFKKNGHVLIDVRTSEEYRGGRIPGAKNIPLNQLQQRVNEIPKDKTVIVVCATGNRSRSGAQIIKNAGVEDVYNLQGGTMRWMMRGWPIEG